MLRNPGAALEALTHTQETFTRHDLARFVFRHTDGAVGDRVMFLRNERSMGVKNGTLATLIALSRSEMEVRLDDGQNLRFYRREYADLTHGYAATIHKMQGATVDRAYILASRHMDRHAAYVALSRHRDATKLRYGREDFATLRDLGRRLGAMRLECELFRHPEPRRR